MAARPDERVELPILVDVDTVDADRRGDVVETGEGEPNRSPQPDGRMLAALAFGLLVIVAVIAVGADSDDAASSPTTQAPLSPIAAPDSEDFAAGPSTSMPVGLSQTGVGTIEWRRVDGAGELPARVDIDVEGDVIGSDPEAAWMRPIDGGGSWLPIEAVERIVSGDRWRQRRSGSGLGLGIVTPIGQRTVDLSDLVEPLPNGFAASIDPVLGLADGFPVELEGEVFLLAATRVGLPWEEFADLGSGGSYRVELSDGERSRRFTRGRFNEMAVEPFHLAPGAARSYDVLDEDGEAVWSFDSDAGRTPLDAATGRSATAWLRWNGSRFVALERPWPDWHDVDMVRIDAGVLARSDGPLHRNVAMWFSHDGYHWTSVDLPGERAERTPVALRRDGGGAIVTQFAPGGLQAWATADGSEFRRLPDVPGVSERRRGDFGWVAADPRSAPTLRLSADGTAWEELDIGPLLDLDASRWDVTITAAATGDSIVVAVDRPEGRSVLLGRVTRDGTG